MRHFGIVNLLSFLFFFIFFALTCSVALDTINPSKPLSDGETLVSATENYELGFLSLSDQKQRYLGIWYKKISPRTIVWIANRETSIFNTTAMLNLTFLGNLVLLGGTKDTIWSSNTSRPASNPIAQLLDTGNFVIREANDGDPENYLWQSFEHPGDTVLPGMNLGLNLVTGHEIYHISWKSIYDPAPGEFSCHFKTSGYPQLILKKGDRLTYRAGSWNGLRLTGIPELRLDPLYVNDIEINDKEIYFKFDTLNRSVFTRIAVGPSGFLQRFKWDERIQDWVTIGTAQADQCDNYASCGPNAKCDTSNAPPCECLDGFVPKTSANWNRQMWSDGCVRSTPLNCSRDGFMKQTGFKLPDTSSSWYDKSIDLKECKKLCLRNCSCSAYSNLDIRNGGSGCLVWFDDLIDIRGFPSGGQDLYVRLASSELGKYEKKYGLSGKAKAGLAVGAVVVLILIIIMGLYAHRGLSKNKGTMKEREGKDAKEDIELPFFELTTIIKATEEFAIHNKLGQGGFGPVYKGTLVDGQEIAVKRLSKNSGQGLTEFKNEVILISKLQHRNLVKLLGCCIDKDEKMLIYEYMPNKSLDSFLFDDTKSKLLDWNMRIHIIWGITKGLLYLHYDSRLRIIHRDLKVSNVLLDKEMNPKISDFGLARTFCEDQSKADTIKVAGTYGYISPEYAIDGVFSMKSDIFSFGVLVLEIISGCKNRGFIHPNHSHNLLGHAWKLWTEERPLELIDNRLNSDIVPKILRCIHVGLLCVQQRPEDRPNVASVVEI